MPLASSVAKGLKQEFYSFLYYMITQGLVNIAKSCFSDGVRGHPAVQLDTGIAEKLAAAAVCVITSADHVSNKWVHLKYGCIVELRRLQSN